jgi:hypothetical protein
METKFKNTYRDQQKPRHRDPSLRSGQAPTATKHTGWPLLVRWLQRTDGFIRFSVRLRLTTSYP